jgi:hypothetical protein
MRCPSNAYEEQCCYSNRANIRIPSDAIVRAETFKKQRGFSGPLILAQDACVSSHVEGKASCNSDLLWNLAFIASYSRGRRRSDDRVSTAEGPEAAIVELLLQDDAREGTNGNDTALTKSPTEKEVCNSAMVRNLS